MLKKLVLKNFQKWKKIVVVFGKGVTTIVGPSDDGKSAILRGLRWICLNDRRGVGHVRNRKGVAEGILYVGKHVIKRRQGKGVNEYWLNNKRYVDFRFKENKVPDDIARVLRMSSVNFQKQTEPHFLFSLTPGQVSKQLNAVINLSQIDNVLARASASVREQERKHEAAKQDLSDARDEVKNLKWVEEFVRDVNDLKKSRDRAKAATARVFANQKLIAKAERASVKCTGLDELKADANKLVAFRTRADAFAAKCQENDRLITEAEESRDSYEAVKKELARAEKALAELTKERCPLCGTTTPSKSRPSATSTLATPHRCSGKKNLTGT